MHIVQPITLVATSAVGIVTMMSYIITSIAVRKQMTHDRVTYAIMAGGRVVHEARTACLMLDYRERTYFVGTKPTSLTSAQVCHSLRIPAVSQTTLELDRKDEYIRDAFDDLLYRLNVVGLELEAKVYRWDDVVRFLGYYIDLMRRQPFFPVIADFANEYGYKTVAEIIRDDTRFEVPQNMRRNRF